MCVCIFLVALCSMQDLSSLIRDQTLALCSRSAESEPLDCQESPSTRLLRWCKSNCGFALHLILKYVLK